MGFFDYIKDMFSAECCEEEGEQISKLPLVRDDEYCIRYRNWVKTGVHRTMCQSIQDVLDMNNKASCEKDNAIAVVNIPTLNGFTMHFKADRWEQDDFKYFFEYLSLVLIKQYQFKRESSTVEKIKYENRTETVERYSLKNKEEGSPYDSILLRLCYTNRQITSIKFCAYTTSKTSNFEAFLNEIASSPKGMDASK